MKPEVLNGEFTYRLAMESDWHVGAGTGIPGHIDRLVARDGDGLPFVPAKTLTGIWRDACERVAAGLDGGRTGGTWHRWVVFLFGDEPGRAGGTSPKGAPPRPAALSLRPARFPEHLRNHLALAPALRQAVTFRKPGVKIRDDGVAEDDCFRIEEMARAGAILEGRGHLNLEHLTQTEARLASTFLLLAGAKTVERLGGKRRRGPGRCRLTVAEREDLVPYLDWAEALGDPPEPPAPHAVEEVRLPAPVAAAAEPGGARRRAGWWVLDLTVRAKMPILAAARTVGNTVESGDEVPGTLLLPIVRRTLADAGIIDIHPWLVEGTFLVLPATPEVAGQRGLPIPQALFHEKEGGGFAYGRGIRNRLLEREGERQLKGYREGHIAPLAEDGWYAVTRTDKAFRTHNAVDDAAQGPVKHTGPGVYNYEAIAAGTVLRSQVRLSDGVRDDLDGRAPDWWRLLEEKGPHRLGRSKKDDYGLAEIRAADPRRLEASKARKRADDELTVWLVSPLLLRSERLGPSALLEDLRRELERNLETRLEPRRSFPGEELLDSVLHPFRLDSWHAPWGLPRPSLMGIRAGGCAVFRVLEDIDPARLAAAESSGIGERRAEGYGQVLFDHPLVTERFADREVSRKRRGTLGPQGERPAPISREDNPEMHAYARLLELAAWREWIERRALALAFAPDGPRTALGLDENRKRPSMSQLGALRAAVRRLRSFDDRGIAAAWLDGVKNTKNRRDAWPEDALKQLEALFQDPGAIWKILGDDPPPVLTERGKEEVRRDLWATAVQGLVKACCVARRTRAEGSPAGFEEGGGHGAAS